mgnify:CR=1 FL=1
MNLKTMRFITIFLLSATLTKPVYAYFDPGAITLFFQLVIAGIVGGIVYLKFYSIKIIQFLKNLLGLNNKKK